MKYILGLFVFIFSLSLMADGRVLSDNAPEDKPVSSTGKAEMDAFFKAQEPYNKQALKSFPQAKKRFLAGLPSGENFFLTTRLHDNLGGVEQVFILVTKISSGVVYGIIYNDIHTVSGYRNGQKYRFPESDILDWLITKPDGSEEGNFVGKFLDTYYAQ